MTFMFDKKTLEGRWFCTETEDTEGYTEKAPPFSNYLWDEERDEWLPPYEAVGAKERAPDG